MQILLARPQDCEIFLNRAASIRAAAARRGFSPLPEKNGQQHPHTQREKPQRRRWSSHGANATEFGRGGARTEEQFLSIAALEKQKYKRRSSAINQVRHQRGKQRRRCARAPVN